MQKLSAAIMVVFLCVGCGDVQEAKSGPSSLPPLTIVYGSNTRPSSPDVAPRIMHHARTAVSTQVPQHAPGIDLRAIDDAIIDLPLWYCTRRHEGGYDSHVGYAGHGHYFLGAFGIEDANWYAYSGYSTSANRLSFAEQVVGARRVLRVIGDGDWGGLKACEGR